MIRRIAVVVLVLLGLVPVSHAATVRLVEPANQATLRGGSVATLRWSAEHLPRDAEEWEAFLSIDGGQYYAFRITPHLDLDRTDVAWIVPNVDATNAKVMIRTGDEEHEATFELPASFSIVRDPHADVPIPSTLPVGRAEAARQGDPDVVGWADGDRDGDDVTVQYGEPAPTSCAAVVAADVWELSPLVRSVGAREHIITTTAARTEADAKRDSVSGPQEFPPTDLLLVCRRRNI